MTHTLNSLSDAERAELKLCGITTEDQLRRCSAVTLQRDLEQARTFFPEQTFTLTAERIAEICGQVGSAETHEENTTEDSVLSGLRAGEMRNPTVRFRNKKNLKQEIIDERRAIAEGKRKENRIIHGFSKHLHAVHCSHPFRAFFGALATLLLPIPLFGLLAVPALLLTDKLDDYKPIYLIAAFVVLVLPYLLIARRADCSVCHMPIFSFGNYSRNRMAHRFPLLGYTLSTALHIVLLMWFRCPACGTPMKLFRPHKHQHAHFH